MKLPDIRTLADLIQDDGNPNRGTERGRSVVETSLRKFGAGRSVLTDRNGKIIAGNKTADAAVDIGLGAKVVHTTGDELVVVVRDDLDFDADNRARGLSIADNRAGEVGLEWDADVLADIVVSDPALLDGIFFDAEVADAIASGDDAPTEDDAPAFIRGDVPDALWPSDNDWGVPTLDTHWQADALDLPVSPWGAHGSRKSRMKGTYHFYTEDYRFTALWDDPTPVLNSRCVNVIEPNFSTNGQMPLAVGLYRIYQKRWLARYWQSHGVRVFVDMNVAEPFWQLNLLGVPHGWRAYATRGYGDYLDNTEREYELACERAGSDDILWVVYGGGKRVKELCQRRSWLWVPEDRDVAKGAAGERKSLSSPSLTLE